MNPKDWIEFAKEKPGHQLIVGIFEGGRKDIVAWSEHGTAHWGRLVWWQPWAEPEKIHPFFEWFRSEDWGECSEDIDKAMKFTRLGWNAAMEWRRQNPE